MVGDLNAITPARYLEFGEAVVHDLSYQQARHFNLPVSGVYVANPGYALATAGIPRGALITALNSKPVANLDDFRRSWSCWVMAIAPPCATPPSMTPTAAS